jgi:hypothetical protein
MTYVSPARIFLGSHSANSPFSIPAAITPWGRLSSTNPHASLLNLSQVSVFRSFPLENLDLYLPRTSLYNSLGPMLADATKIIFISIQETGRPNFQRTFVAEGFVQSTSHSACRQQWQCRSRRPGERRRPVYLFKLHFVDSAKPLCRGQRERYKCGRKDNKWLILASDFLGCVWATRRTDLGYPALK